MGRRQTQTNADTIHKKRELALYLFERDKLSFGKAREMAEMTAWEFQLLLESRGIAVHYGVREYEEDLATLKMMTTATEFFSAVGNRASS